MQNCSKGNGKQGNNCTQAVLRIPPHCGSPADPEGTAGRDTARGCSLTALCSNSPNKHVSVMQVGEYIAP